MFVPSRIRSEDSAVLTFIYTLSLGTPDKYQAHTASHVSLTLLWGKTASRYTFNDDAFHTRWKYWTENYTHAWQDKWKEYNPLKIKLQ